MFTEDNTEAVVENADATPSAAESETVDSIDEEPLSGEASEDVEDSEEPEELEDESEESDEEESEDEKLAKYAEDENTPAFARRQIKAAMERLHLANEAKGSVEQELTTLKQQFEGKEALDPAEIENLRKVEEDYLKISSFASTPDEILKSFREIVPQQKLSEVQQHLVWQYLEQPDGTPDLDSLQVIVDRFAGTDDPNERVYAKDVLMAINALKDGTIDVTQLHNFGTDEEYEQFKRAEDLRREAESYRDAQRQSSLQAEQSLRQTALQPVKQQMQQTLASQIDPIFKKFKLEASDKDPQWAKDFKQDLKERVFQRLAALPNRAMSEVWQALEILEKPTGAKFENAQQEIKSYTEGRNFKALTSKGLSELVSEAEKIISREAYVYAMAARGYETKPKSREVVGKANQSKGKSKTSAELKAMSANEYLEESLLQRTELLRAG